MLNHSLRCVGKRNLHSGVFSASKLSFSAFSSSYSSSSLSSSQRLHHTAPTALKRSLTRKFRSVLDESLPRSKNSRLQQAQYEPQSLCISGQRRSLCPSRRNPQNPWRVQANNLSLLTRNSSSSHNREEDEGNSIVSLTKEDDDDKTAVSTASRLEFGEYYTPESIVEKLDKYIIGQKEAKRSLAIALRDRWRRQRIADENLCKEITPNNILLIGPSGCGKTELARRLATIADAPFVKVVATRYTEVGFVGDDTQSMLQELAEQAFADEQQRQRKKNIKEATEKAYETLIAAVQKLPDFHDWTETSIRQHIEAGRFADLKVELDASLLKKNDGPNIPFSEMFSSMGGSSLGRLNPRMGMMISAVPSTDVSSLMQELFDGGKKGKKLPMREIKIKDALPLLEDHYVSEMIIDEDVIEAAKTATEQHGIIFIDEFDKLIDPKEGNDFRSKRRGVQKELLTLMEGTTIATRLGRVSTDHILFIASGAFTSSKPADIMPELQGRLPVRCELAPLSEEDFVKILKETRYNPLVQQQALMMTEGVSLTFTDDAVIEIARIAHRLNSMSANVGARRLKTVISKLLEEVKYNAHKISGTNVEITADLVKERLSALQKRADLSRYII